LDKRKIIIIAASVLLTVALVLVLIRTGAFRSHKGIDPVYAMPDNAILFFSGRNFQEVYSQLSSTGMWQDLNKVQEFNDFNNQIDKIIKRIKTNGDLRRQMENQPLLLSLHRTSLSKIDVLAIINSGKNFDFEDIDKLIKPDFNGRLLKREYEGTLIYDYVLTVQKSLLAFSFVGDLFVISPNALLVEDAIKTYTRNIRKKGSPLIIPDKKQGDENWYVNYREINSLLAVFLKPESQSLLTGLKNFGGIGKYEFLNAEDMLSFRGNISGLDSVRDFISLFSNQKPGKNEIPKILSDRTAVLMTWTVPDINTYYLNFKKRTKANAKPGDFEKTKNELEKKYDINIEKDVLPLLDGQFALAVSEMADDNLLAGSCIILRIKDTDKAKQEFYRPGAGTDTFKTGFIQKYRDYEIFGSKLTEIFSLVFGTSFSNIKNCYYTNIREYFLFCPDLTNLHNMVDDYIAQRTLGSSSIFSKQTEKFGSESNFLFYINPVLSLKIPCQYGDTAFLASYRRNLEYYKKFSFFAFQVTNNNNNYYSEIVSNYTPVFKAARETIWETELDTTFSVKPYIVRNHKDQTNEVLLFDDNHSVYLISSGGKILWKKQLESELKGDVYQVDFYDNDKLQYLFATENAIHLIDRNGQNVPGYPIKLNARATTGLALFNFSSKNEFIFFVGCANGTICGYSRTGAPVKYWNPKKIAGVPDLPMKYFKNGNNIYYLCITSSGTFYIWAPNGKEVSKPLNLKTRFKNPFYLKDADVFAKNALISTDTNGTTYYIYANGTADQQKYGDWTGSVFNDYIDMNGDGLKDLVFADVNTVTTYTAEGKILSSFNLQNPVTIRPYYLKMKGKIYIGYLDKLNGKLFLSDDNGKNLPNFPINCNSPFEFYDLNQDGAIEIIGGLNKKIFLTRF
jgi:hypothetical protein